MRQLHAFYGVLLSSPLTHPSPSPFFFGLCPNKKGNGESRRGKREKKKKDMHKLFPDRKT